MAAVVYLNDRRAGTHVYWPEMGDRKPECKIEATMSYDAKHYYLDTPLELKGRGITFIKQYKSCELTALGQYKTGWNHYEVTRRAFRLLEQQYPVSMEALLD